MARGFSNTVENNFTKGLVTEYSAMNFPENAVTEGDNCVYNELGIVSRRYGIDYETDNQIFALSSLTSNPGAYTEYVWYSVGNDGTITFLVQQVGDKIFFFYGDGSGNISSDKKSFSIDLSDFKVSSVSVSVLKNKICRFTSGKGYMFVSNPVCDPFVVEYDPDTDTITTSVINIEVRDFERFDDDLDVDEHPTTLSNIHKYNIYNQGWYFIEDGTNVATQWYNYWHTYPSNVDIWWVLKDSKEDFKPARANNFTLGNTPAPNGHYIYSAWNIDRSDKTGFTGLPSLSSNDARPSTIKFYAGRVFYSGVSSPKYSNVVYFSQIVESDDQLGKCYQLNDPTAESTFDLIDTDGGTILLAQIQDIIDMKVVGDALLVFGSNGVAAIRGNDNGPFRATNFTVDYISNSGANSPLSIIEVENNVLWWNNDGIYTLSKDQIGVSFVVNNISKESIQSFVNNIPSVNKPYIKVAYNKKDKIIRWIMSDDESLTGFNYNRIIDLNIISKAFYSHTIDTTLAPRISGIFSIAGQGLNIVEEDVVVSSDNVVVSGETVISIENNFIPNVDVFKFTTVGNISSGSPGLTFSELNNTGYLDWETFNGVGASYSSYGVSGYRIRGEMLRNFNSSVISFVMKQADDSQLILHGIWNYGEKMTSGQQIYRESNGADYIIRRVKLRGKGKSLQLKFQSVANYPFFLVGWSTFETGGTLP